MTDNASGEPQDIIPEEADGEEEDEFDYIPSFIKNLLDNPELLPREIRKDFASVFEVFEFTHRGRAKTAHEYMLVNEATKLTLSLQHLDRVENAILINQQRPAIKSLFRKTHDGAAMKGAGAAIDIEATLSGKNYFADPVFKAKADKAFEAAGYAPNALEGEAYQRALPSLTVIHRQKASDRKALLSILKELEARYNSRHPEKRMVVEKPAGKTSRSKDG